MSDGQEDETVRLRSPTASEAPSPTRVPEPGLVVGDRFVLKGRLGAGGMGEVWRAEASDLGVEVALKLLDESELTPSERQDLRTRFKQEARLLAAINDDRIVRYLDHGETEEGTLFLAMELLEGQTLSDRIACGDPMSPVETLVLLRDIAIGVGSAHAHDLVHRDLKPGNLFIAAPRGDVRILDFGIAKSLLVDADTATGAPRTRTGMFIGSPHYMAPEQFDGAASPASDIYALGIIAWECLAGRRPFEGTTAAVVGMQLFHEPPCLPLDLEVPADVEALVLDMLAKDPQDRVGDVPRLIRRIDDTLDSLRPSGPRLALRPWLNAALALSVGAAAWSYRGVIMEAAEGVLSAPPPPIAENMVKVGGGPFFMGCSKASDPSCSGPPGRQVEVSSFFIDRTEVSVVEFSRCVEAGACSKGGLDLPKLNGALVREQAEHCTFGHADRTDHPINCVDWYAAAKYCAWRKARLPTEAEWEKAARGVDARRFPWGNRDFSYREANVADRTARRHFGWRFASSGYNDLRPTTAPVGDVSEGMSPYGALDMVGNVWEWTQGGGDTARVFRGASFLDSPGKARVTSRGVGPASNRGVNLGSAARARCERARIGL